SFEVLSALGNLYYENGRYLEAIDAYREAEALAAPAEARALALKKKQVKPAADLPAECRRSGPDYGLSKIAEAAGKLDEPHELRCLDAALEMELQTVSRRGNAFYLIGNPDSALAEHRKVLERSPEYPESLFFVGAILEQSEKELDQGRYQEARDAVVRVMPMRPDDARTAAAMGGAMRGLGRVQMAERTLSRALQLDPKQPRALYEMGRLLAQQGDKAGALQRFNALKSADPKFAQSHRVDDE